MAEGGVAAALGNVAEADSWQVHFRDTMVGGKLLNEPRMAQFHAQEAPARVNELERWGAVFDRTRDGRILQRPFGGHSHPRLAHVGDRTGLEMIRTLQDQAVALGIDVYMECTITHLTTGLGRTTGAFGYWRTTGRPIVFPAKAVVLATGGIGKAYEITSNSWEYSGDGQALAYHAGAELIDMEFVQFHPTGMVWPPGVRGLLVTEAVRGEGGILRNSLDERFMWKYLPEDRRAEYAATDEEAAQLGDRPVGGTPDRRSPATGAVHPGQRLQGHLHRGPRGPWLAARRRVPRHQLPARPTTSGASCPRCTSSSRSSPTSTSPKGPMEVGPTTHYVMGGIRVDAETGATTLPGLFAAGEVAGGMHGANRLGGNSLSDLLVFGARTGAGAASYAAQIAEQPHVDPVQVQDAKRELEAPLERTAGEDPYAIQRDLQSTMQRLVGIFRDDADLGDALAELAILRSRSETLCVERGTGLQPRLEPRLRAAEPAHHLRGRDPQRSAPDGEPRRPQPDRLPGDR